MVPASAPVLIPADFPFHGAGLGPRTVSQINPFLAELLVVQMFSKQQKSANNTGKQVSRAFRRRSAIFFCL